jgi:arylsulfatase A-like enzyme
VVSRLAALLGALLLVSGCREPGSDYYVDLMRQAEELELLDESGVQLLTWNLAGDHRPRLYQAPPRQLTFGLPPDETCRLRFAIGLNEPGWEKSDGVVFRVVLRADAGDEMVFEERLVPSPDEEPRWLDREVPIPARGTDVALVLETDPGPAGNGAYDHAGWAAPHLVCQGARPPRRTGATRPDVILISVDTLRADHLHLYGYPRPTSPNLDALGAESLTFENAFAPASWTVPSHASMLTGLEPHQHGAGHASPSAPLGTGFPTLAELLAEAGYRTLAFTAGGLMSRRSGLDRGFQVWTERPRANLESMLPSIFAALDRDHAEPLFLLVHTYDVHGPYAELPGVEPVPGSVEPTASGRATEEWERIRSISIHDYQKLERFAGVDDVIDAYDAGIRWVDARLGRLFDRLKEIGIYQDALVIVTSDHGESLYDRKLYLGHSYTLYDPEVRVPLIVRLPEATRRGRVEELVGLEDLVPLILQVVGTGSPSGLAGTDPLARIDGRTPQREGVTGEASHTGARYARSVDLKLIGAARPVEDPASRLPGRLRDRFEAAEQLFDLGVDPTEGRNLADTGLQESEAKSLRAWIEERPRPGGELSEVDLEPEEADQLRALGYLE